MATLIFKNETLTVQSVSDLGIEIQPNEDLDLISNFRDEDLLESTDLSGAMTAGVKCYLNGTEELTYAELIEYLTKLTKYDTIDYSYISGKDTTTDVTGAELEALTDGSDTTLHIHDNRYYTETELSTSNAGTVAVHWDNITNSPSFGALHWKEPAKAMLDEKGTAVEMAASVLPDGSFWWNTTDNLIYKKISGTWTSIGTPAEGWRVVFHDGVSSDNKIYKYTSGSWDTGTAAAASWALIVSDDGDGKSAQYVFDDSAAEWVKIADVDWGNASGIGLTPSGNLTSTNVQNGMYELQAELDLASLDEAYKKGSVVNVNNTIVDWRLTDTKSFKITSDTGTTDLFKVSAAGAGDTVTINGALDVNGGAVTIDGSSISIASTGQLTLKDQWLTTGIAISQSGNAALIDFTATSIVGALNELKSNLGDVSVTLDDAYDGPTEDGAGREITVDQGAVVLNASSSTYAPLELTQLAAAPTSGLANGQIVVIDGHMYLYDAIRSKWLSISEDHYFFSENVSKNKYMSIGSAFGSTVGYRVPMDCTIVKVAAVQSLGSATASLQLRKNSSTTAIKTFSLVSGSYTSTNDNIDLAAGDTIQAFVGSSEVKNCVVSIFIKRRK